MKPEEDIVDFREPVPDAELLHKGFAGLPRALARMNFESLRPGQDKIVRNLLAGIDTISIMPTSGGKTACFVIPALCHDWRLLVFSPLKSLMMDQVRGLEEKGIVAAALSSDNTETLNNRNLADWADGNCKILFVAPERLKNQDFRRVIKFAPPDMVAVDECHTVSSWSDSFRHHYVYIGELIEEFQPRLVAGFTATYSEEVDVDVRRVLRVPKASLMAFYPRRENLKLSSSYREEGDLDDLIDRIRRVDGPTLIYCDSRNRTEHLAAELSHSLNEPVGFYNAGVAGLTKKEMQSGFLGDRIRIMTATNAFGMGIDKPNIRAVIHWDHPMDPEALSQECVHPDSWISTSSGLKMAPEVGLGEKMIDCGFSDRGTREAAVKETMKNQFEGKLCNVRTKLGSTLRLTPSHPVFVSRSGSVVEVPAGELVVGDSLLAHKNLAPAEVCRQPVIDLLSDCPEAVYAGIGPSLLDDLRERLSVEQLCDVFRLASLNDYTMYRGLHKAPRLDYLREACQLAEISEEVMRAGITYFKTRSSRKIVLPEYLNSDLSWLAGIMASEGYMFKQARKSDTFGFYGIRKIKLSTTCPVIADKFQRVLEDLELPLSRLERKNHRTSVAGSKKDVFICEAPSPLVMHLLNRLGIPSRAKYYSVTVPSWLRSEDPEVRGAYLAGVIDGGGSIRSSGSHMVIIHSAPWDMVSGLSGLFRGFGVPVSCYPEDYSCKSDVMQECSDRGYSLMVSSSEDLDVMRGIIAPHMCKQMPGDMLPVRKSRRPKVDHVVASWLKDEVLELHTENYSGDVLNWNVEPGNQLVVEGVLTHNCGRAGRDGKDSWCHAYQSDRAASMCRRRLQSNHPTREKIERFYEFVRSSVDGQGVLNCTAGEIQKTMRISEYDYAPLMQHFMGAGILVEDKKIPRSHNILIDGECETKIFSKFSEALVEMSSPGNALGPGTMTFDLDNLASSIECSPGTLRKHINGWKADGILRYLPPSRTSPKRLVGDLSLLDIERLELKRKRAYEKLNVVLGYFEVDDCDKHEYLENYFTSFIKGSHSGD